MHGKAIPIQTNVAVPAQTNVMRLIYKHWSLISAALLCALSLGIAKGKYSDVQATVDEIQKTQPATTAAMTTRNTTEISNVRGELARVHDEVTLTRIDVARISGQFGLRPLTASDVPPPTTRPIGQ